MNREITLQCQYSRPTDALLEIRYKLSNQSARAIYAFTPLSDYHNNQYVPAPRRVYVQLAPNGLVTLSKQLWSTPETVSVFMPEVPFLTRIAAGGTLDETLVVPVPLIVNYPYLGSDARERGVQQRESGSAVFVIGYIQDDNQLKVAEASGSPGLFAISYGPGITRQKLLSCEPVPMKAAVIAR